MPLFNPYVTQSARQFGFAPPMSSSGAADGRLAALQSTVASVRREAMLAVLQAHRDGAGAAVAVERRDAAVAAATAHLGALRVNGVPWQENLVCAAISGNVGGLLRRASSLPGHAPPPMAGGVCVGNLGFCSIDLLSVR